MKWHYELLKHANGLIENYPMVAYEFADVNCSNALKLKDNTFCFFNDKSQLDNILFMILTVINFKE